MEHLQAHILSPLPGISALHVTQPECIQAPKTTYQVNCMRAISENDTECAFTQNFVLC